MRTRLAYGKQGLDLELPDEWDITVVEPTYVPGIRDAQVALAHALAHPIGALPLPDLLPPGGKIGIVFTDITRATPNHILLPAVIAALGAVDPQRIILFNALGTHRQNTEVELRQMLGDALVDGYRIVQNDAYDLSTQVCLGTSSRGHEIWLNRELVDCDLKILTGFIEPHFFAGFSGGGKAIMPGMAGAKTVLGNHDVSMIGSPNATWGVTHGNPIWEEIHEIARWAEATFLVNVTLNKDKEITGIFTGELNQAHTRGCAFVKESAMAAFPKSFDIVITTNSGYPLDLNLYQTVKGMSAAVQVVRHGGAILVASECWDGIPEHGLYGQLLHSASSPSALLEEIRSPGFLKQDQWQAQIQAQIQLKADVYVYSGYLSDEQIRSAMLLPCTDIRQTVGELLQRPGSGGRICVLPEGPQTIPYIRAVEEAL